MKKSDSFPLEIPLNQFDLKALWESGTSLEEGGDDPYTGFYLLGPFKKEEAEVWATVQSLDHDEIWGGEECEDFLPVRELVKGHGLFIPFTPLLSYALQNGSMVCGDGQVYRFDSEDEESGLFGEFDVIGFIVHLDDERLIIDVGLSVHLGPQGPRVYHWKHWRKLDVAMETHIRTSTNPGD